MGVIPSPLSVTSDKCYTCSELALFWQSIKGINKITIAKFSMLTV